MPGLISIPFGTVAITEYFLSPAIRRTVTEAMKVPESARSSWVTMQISFFVTLSVSQVFTHGGKAAGGAAGAAAGAAVGSAAAC